MKKSDERKTCTHCKERRAVSCVKVRKHKVHMVQFKYREDHDLCMQCNAALEDRVRCR